MRFPVLARPIRSWRMATRYAWPHRLTIRPVEMVGGHFGHIYAWLWWNI